jgi:hypothetical protein
VDVIFEREHVLDGSSESPHAKAIENDDEKRNHQKKEDPK